MHHTTIHVRWGELDPYHHVNHATYLSYLEHARVAALESVGWGMETLSNAGYQVVIVHADVRFRRPATAGDTLDITTGLEELGASRSVWRQKIHRDAELLTEARMEAACTDLTGRPVRSPESLRSSLEALR